MANAKLFECIPSDMASLERVRYFPRMLITPDDMTAEQQYLRNKLRRHNRLLHGWGVVCGCEVTPGEKEFEVKITPGYILGPYGDEIIIWKELTYDIRTELVCGCTVESGNGMHQIDPWCSDVKKPTVSGQTCYVAVKYKEIETRPVRAHPVGCSCDQVHCESSRILDSFIVKALNTLPSSHNPEDPSSVPPLSDPNQIISGQLESCVECPAEPWVVLADVTIGDNNIIEVCNIDNCCHRRWVISLADVWWKCRAKPSISSIYPNEGTQDQTLGEVIIHGCNFMDTPTVDFGDDITLESVIFNSAWKLTVTNLQIGENAAKGLRDVTITNPEPDGQSTTLIDGFNVIDPSLLIAEPAIRRIFPAKIESGKIQKVNISGRNFMKGVSLNFGTGITVSETIFKSYKELIVTLDIDAFTKPGLREVSITNPGEAEKKFKNLFTVIVAKKTKDPIIEGITQPKLNAGEEATIVIKGDNFEDGLEVDFGKSKESKISLKEIVSITDNEVHVKIKVWKNAKSGPRKLNVTNPGGKPISHSVDLEIET